MLCLVYVCAASVFREKLLWWEKRTQKTDSVSQVCGFSLFSLFFSSALCSLLHLPFAPSHLYATTHTHHTHPLSVWGSPFSSLSHITHPLSFVPFPHLVTSHLPHLFFLGLSSLHSSLLSVVFLIAPSLFLSRV